MNAHSNWYGIRVRLLINQDCKEEWIIGHTTRLKEFRINNPDNFERALVYSLHSSQDQLTYRTGEQSLEVALVSIETEIERFVKDRKIEHLCHFTRADNLPNIMEYGLLSKYELDRRGIEHKWNDPNRLDKHVFGISLSITWPNYRMFYTLRTRNRDCDWVVLTLSPRILSEKDCAFFETNAASSMMKRVPLESRRGLKGIERLFVDFPGEDGTLVKRSDLNLERPWTTNPQAEVLVFDKIEPRYIQKIFSIKNHQTSETEVPLADGIEWLKVESDSSWPFGARRDYKHWQTSDELDESPSGYKGEQSC